MRRIAVIGLGLLLLAFIALSASASAAPTTVVSPTGRVDGRTYGQWLAKSWQVRLAKPPSSSLCQHVGKVEMFLSGPPRGFQPSRTTHKCSVPVGHPVYVPAWGAECSTIEKPPFGGRTPRQLKACGRRFTERHWSRFIVEVDGKAVPHIRSFVKTSPVFRFHMPRRNILHLRKRSGRGAAYGAGFLLRGLAVGPHVLYRSDYYAGWRYETTYRIQVRG